MKKYIAIAVLFQAYMLSRCPDNGSMEVILAGRAMHQGLWLYRDFSCHYGPVMPILFWVLQPGLFGAALVYGLFNLLTAWGIYNLGTVCLKHMGDNASTLHGSPAFAALLFLLLKPWFFGDAWNVETPMVCFGVWAFYLAATQRKGWAALLVGLAFLVKQPGAIYALCLL